LRCPVHITLRAAAGLPSLRGKRVFAAVRAGFRAASNDAFRLLQFSVQADHVHMLVEADGGTALTRGVQGLAIRVAKAINRVLGRRGAVWGDRFHSRALKTPREVRNALVYVLNNFKKHVRGAQGLDGCSSAAWFSGWRNVVPASLATAPVAQGRTWLARVGWRRHGLLEIGDEPGRQKNRRGHDRRRWLAANRRAAPPAH
jgi:REP element-mobilizing transposase RayT